MADKTKIIIDTDIGDDIDDALAIGLALNSPEVELLGVTTVFKNTKARARLARLLLDTAGRPDIPVFAGCGQPLNNPVDETEEFPQYLDKARAVKMDFSRSAVDYLIEQGRLHAGDLTVITIGAMTNLAVALKAAPELKNQISRVISMGGCFYSHFNEWNILCDPEAVDIVLRSGMKVLMVGLDVTTRCTVPAADFEEALLRTDRPLNLLLRELVMAWHGQTGVAPVLHDPLAVYAVYADEKVLAHRREQVAVELAGKLTRGMTFNFTGGEWRENAERPDGNVEICCAVDNKRFVADFLARLGA